MLRGETVLAGCRSGEVRERRGEGREQRRGEERKGEKATVV